MQYWLLYTRPYIYDGVCVRMLLSVSAADQAAEILYAFSLDLRLVKLVPVNYCFYKKLILKLFSVCCRYILYMNHLVLLVVGQNLRIHGLGSA